jgi:hypothetical protein
LKRKVWRFSQTMQLEYLFLAERKLLDDEIQWKALLFSRALLNEKKSLIFLTASSRRRFCNGHGQLLLSFRVLFTMALLFWELFLDTSLSWTRRLFQCIFKTRWRFYDALMNAISFLSVLSSMISRQLLLEIGIASQCSGGVYSARHDEILKTERSWQHLVKIYVCKSKFEGEV